MKLTIPIAGAALVAALFCAPGRADIALIPTGGALTGSPGQTVGWGFTLTNSTDFALISSSDYVTLTPLGAYQDIISSQYRVIGPAPESPLWSETFDLANSLGLGSYHITSTVPGHSDGVILVTYDLYSVSPNDPAFNPTTDYLRSSSFSADASIDVIASVPDGGVFPLILAAALGLLGAATFKRRSRRF